MASYTSLDSFVTEIRQYAPGAPPIMIRGHVRNTIINFCERTFILKRSPADFMLNEDQHTYTLKYSGDRYVTIAIKVIRVGDGDSGDLLSETTEHYLDNTLPGWQTHEGSKPTGYMLLDDVNSIRVYPIPTEDSSDDVVVEACVRPRRDQTEVDTFLYEKWEETIQAGALAALLSIPQATWYNPDLARMSAEAYKRGIRRARKTTTVGTTEIPGQVVPQTYGAAGMTGLNYKESI